MIGDELEQFTTTLSLDTHRFVVELFQQFCASLVELLQGEERVMTQSGVEGVYTITA